MARIQPFLMNDDQVFDQDDAVSDEKSSAVSQIHSLDQNQVFKLTFAISSVWSSSGVNASEDFRCPRRLVGALAAKRKDEEGLVIE